MPKPKPSTSKPWKQQQKDKGKQERAAEREKQAVQAQQAAAKSRETPKLSWPDSRPPTEARDQYRFLNPYNFVRYLPEPAAAPDDPDAQLLGRCAPPPHDRYVGLTGRITCTLETVTPLFISDSHDIKVTKTRLADGREVEHKSYRFFQYAGKDAIPATQPARNDPLVVRGRDQLTVQRFRQRRATGVSHRSSRSAAFQARHRAFAASGRKTRRHCSV
jgi:hypothetical protein